MHFEKEVFDEFMIKGTVNVILSLPPRLTTVSLTTLFEQQLFYQTCYSLKGVFVKNERGYRLILNLFRV